MMLQGYSVYVAPDQDYPVGQFVRKSDERDNAIGYQKSAFLFHLLRREIGDEAFWRALKTFVGRYRDRPADWESIETVFAQAMWLKTWLGPQRAFLSITLHQPHQSV